MIKSSWARYLSDCHNEDIEDVIVMGLRVPGIRIDRAAFLQKELQNSEFMPEFSPSIKQESLMRGAQRV